MKKLLAACAVAFSPALPALMALKMTNVVLIALFFFQSELIIALAGGLAAFFAADFLRLPVNSLIVGL